MNRKELYNRIREQSSFLCVGLDPDPLLIPEFLRNQPEGLLQFNKSIIEATKEYCVAYKPNLAFYECLGSKGWALYEETLALIPSTHFIIADAKRGDIGNTSGKYAMAFFDPDLSYKIDAVTVNPYMGKDAVEPFLNYPDKWVVLLALTSNPGSADFQLQTLLNGRKVYEQVILEAKTWGTEDQIMFVTGATHAAALLEIRKLIPDHFLLIPGIGAQGGNLKEVCRAGMNSECGLLVNAGRSILYASSEKDFAARARSEAKRMQEEMKLYLEERCQA